MKILMVTSSYPKFPGDVTAVVARIVEETQDRPGTGLRLDPKDDSALRAALEKQ